MGLTHTNIPSVASEHQTGYMPPEHRTKKDFLSVVDEKVQRWASAVVYDKPYEKTYTKSEPGYFKSFVSYMRFDFTSISFDNRSRSEKREDEALFYGVIALVAGVFAMCFWGVDYQKVNKRITTLEKGEKELINNRDRQDPNFAIFKQKFENAMKMLQDQQRSLEWKLGLSGGLTGSGVLWISGSLLSSSAMITAGTVLGIATLVAFTARTALTWKKSEYPEQSSLMNWFPLNWVSRTEKKAACEVLGLTFVKQR